MAPGDAAVRRRHAFAGRGDGRGKCNGGSGRKRRQPGIASVRRLLWTSGGTGTVNLVRPNEASPDWIARESVVDGALKAMQKAILNFAGQLHARRLPVAVRDCDWQGQDVPVPSGMRPGWDAMSPVGRRGLVGAGGPSPTGPRGEAGRGEWEAGARAGALGEGSRHGSPGKRPGKPGKNAA